MRYSVSASGESRSFPPGDPFLEGAVPDADADVTVHIGTPLVAASGKKAILVELRDECLGVHTGEEEGGEGSIVLGFARYRNGDAPPTSLVEVVRQPQTDEKAIEAALAVFRGAGLTPVLCTDQAGRIVDRLVRPVYNAALRFLDEGLATREALDTTCRLGLGYSEGPIERVVRGGLVAHYDICRSLFEVYGTLAYAPARRAVTAARRRGRP